MTSEEIFFSEEKSALKRCVESKIKVLTTSEKMNKEYFYISEKEKYEQHKGEAGRGNRGI